MEIHTNALGIFNGGVGGYCLMCSDAGCGVEGGEQDKAEGWFVVVGVGEDTNTEDHIEAEKNIFYDQGQI